jgi:hypothetical protein
MNCEDAELEMSGAGETSIELRAHVEGCTSCQETSRLLGLAALPPLSQSERLLLNGLAPSTQQIWRAQHRRGDGLRRGATLVLAAGIGALLASAFIHRPAKDPEVRTVMVTAPEIPVLDFEEANLSDDEVFFEVGWPSPTEGDL